MSLALERLWYPSVPETVVRKLALSPLLLPAGLFQAGVTLRNALYHRGVFKARRVSKAFVISVGNVAVGGSGKTPAVIYLANLLARHGKRPAVLSRGYGRTQREPLLLRGGDVSSVEEAGDEPLVIARNCPGVPVWVGKDRAELAKRAVAELGADVLLLDDGMQHRKLARDLEIGVVDESAGFGNGHLLPRGPLREPPSALARSQLIWLVAQDFPAVKALPAGIPIVRVRYQAKGLLRPHETAAHAAEPLAGQGIIALAGIARPHRFVRTLASLNMRVEATFFFPDHHVFKSAELQRVLEAASRTGLPIVTTEKDRARLPPHYPAWAVRLEAEVITGEDVLMSYLRLRT